MYLPYCICAYIDKRPIHVCLKLYWNCCYRFDDIPSCFFFFEQIYNILKKFWYKCVYAVDIEFCIWCNVFVYIIYSCVTVSSWWRLLPYVHISNVYLFASLCLSIHKSMMIIWKISLSCRINVYCGLINVLGFQNYIKLIWKQICL